LTRRFSIRRSNAMPARASSTGWPDKLSAKHPAEQHQHGKPDHEPPNRPLALYALEMLDALPSPIAPGPGVAFGAKHEHPDEAEAGNERQERDIRLVANAPDPIEKEGAPIPTPDFRRDDFRIGTGGRVAP